MIVGGKPFELSIAVGERLAVLVVEAEEESNT